MSSSSDLCSSRKAPLEPRAVKEWFDSDGRLVKEAVMRKALFEGRLEGVLCFCGREKFSLIARGHSRVSL